MLDTEEIKLGKDTVHGVVMKMQTDQAVEEIEQPTVKVNEMFQKWNEDDERVEEKRTVELKLP